MRWSFIGVSLSWSLQFERAARSKGRASRQASLSFAAARPLLEYPRRGGSSIEMKLKLEPGDVEMLLTPEGRALLPLSHQLMLYLDPFAFFKDASRGNPWVREAALRYNRRQRSMLLTYIRRWLLIAAGSFLGIASSETLAAHLPLFIIPAAGFGIGFSIALVFSAWIAAIYLLLGARASID
jgi:hypothetical protein